MFINLKILNNFYISFLLRKYMNYISTYIINCTLLIIKFVQLLKTFQVIEIILLHWFLQPIQFNGGAIKNLYN